MNIKDIAITANLQIGVVIKISRQETLNGDKTLITLRLPEIELECLESEVVVFKSYNNGEIVELLKTTPSYLKAENYIIALDNPVKVSPVIIPSIESAPITDIPVAEENLPF